MSQLEPLKNMVNPDGSINEPNYRKLLMVKAETCRNSDRKEVRNLWNPNRQWFKGQGGVQVTDEGLQRQTDILCALRRHGPLAIREIRQVLGGITDKDRLTISGLDRLVMQGAILKDSSDRPIQYVLADGFDQITPEPAAA